MAKAPRKKYTPKRKGPSAGEKKIDQATQEITEEILDFWKAIGSSKLGEWQRPWVYSMMLSENAGKYLLSGERYVYKGGMNQFLVAFAARDKSDEYGSLVMTKTDLTKMFFGDQS